jgi:sporulation protein YlmC with PRC-barrel domain
MMFPYPEQPGNNAEQQAGQQPFQPQPLFSNQPTQPLQSPSPVPENLFVPPVPPQPEVISAQAPWATFSQLRGHPLIAITEGKKRGEVYDLLLDQQRRSIQAFATRGRLLHGPLLIPSSKATIGKDAVTFEPGALAGQDTSWLDALPKASALLGMRVLTNTGQFLGTVEDLRINTRDGVLIALELTPGQAGTAHRIDSRRQILPTTSVISYGPDAIVAMENALSDA